VAVLKEAQILYFYTYKYSTQMKNIFTPDPEYTTVQVMPLKVRRKNRRGKN
jgi:hypothetical protein